MKKTRNLGIKWPHWHALMFSDEMKIDMLSERCLKKMLVQRARSVYWKKWAAKHGFSGIKSQEDFFGRWVDAKETVRC